jgi:DNA-binding NarL/FixJ family response regulator
LESERQHPCGSAETRSGPVEEYQIVLADDHAMVRHGIRRIIEERMDMEIVGEAADGLELMNLLKKVQPHLIILDISMPHLRGLEAAREIKSLHPQIKVLILTMHKNEAYLKQAVAVGCEGYVLKEDVGEQLIEAVETIRNDEIFVSGLFSDEVTHIGKKAPRSLRGVPQCDRLTSRERQILKLVAEGKSNREIAELLYVSIRTVEHHRFSMNRKLKVNNAMNLIHYAIREGYVAVESNGYHPDSLYSEGVQSPALTPPEARRAGGNGWRDGHDVC